MNRSRARLFTWLLPLTFTLIGASCNRNTPVKDSEVRSEAPQATPEEAARVTKPASPPLVVPEGLEIPVRLVPTLSTDTHKTGESFDATLAEPLMVGGRTIAPKGARVTGAVVEADPGGRVKGVARIAVQLTHLQLTGGKEVEISTNTVARRAAATKRQDAGKVGIGAGVGAAIGAIAGGGKGAAIGAAAGAGAGSGVVLATRGKAAVVPSETLLRFKLKYPVRVPD